MMKKRHGTRLIILLGLVVALMLFGVMNMGCTRRDRRPLPPQPVLLEPAHESDGVGLRPTFRWQGGLPTDFYYLYYSDQPDPVLHSIAEPIPIQTEEYTLPEQWQLEPNTTYYWLVMACIDYGQGKFGTTRSEIRSFTTTANP